MPKMNSIYTPKQAVITKIIEETPTIKTLVLKPEEEFSFSTGQFIELTYPGKGEAPFTPSSDPNRKEELENLMKSFNYRVKWLDKNHLFASKGGKLK